MECRKNYFRRLCLFFLLAFLILSPYIAYSQEEETLPGGFSNLPSIENSTFTGAAVFSVHIEVPPGRNDMAPNINLIYTNTQKNSWVGVGWNLDMGAIQRSTKFGVDYSANNFVAAANGSVSELVPRGDWGTNYYGAKIEGAFSKYYYNATTQGWEVTAKNGTMYFYGSTSASRQDNSGAIFKWCLDKVLDTNGNYMTVSYVKDSGEIYLDRIDYTGDASLSPTNVVKFYRELRDDAPYMYVPNFAVKTRYRLKTIEISANGNLARAYHLNYENTGTTTSRSVLSLVQLFGSDASVASNGTVTGTNMLPVFSAAYDAGGSCLATPSYDYPGLPATIAGGYTTYNSNGAYMQIGDFNGDGKMDIMWMPSNGDGRWLIAYGTDNGFAIPDYNNPALPATTSGGYTTNNSNGAYMLIGDFNGDGKTDYLWMPSNGDNRWLIAYGTASGFTTPDYNNPALPATISGGYTTNNPTNGYIRIGDFNGDGKVDFMWIPSNGDGRWLVAYGTSSGFTTPDYNSPALPATLSGGYTTKHTSGAYMLTGDFNGDGKTDYMWIPSNGDGRWLIAYGTSSGFTTPDYNSPALTATISSGYTSFHASLPYMLTADFNGDGKTDYMWVPSNGDGRWIIAYGTGSGFASPDYNSPALPATISGGYTTTNPNVTLKIGDFNGDGKMDYIWSPSNGDGRWLIAYSTGSGFTTSDYNIPALPATIPSGYATNNSNNAYMRIGDFNGDGKTDYLWMPSNGDGRWVIAFANSPDHLPDVMTSAANAIGGTHSIAYTFSTKFVNTQLQFPVQIVQSITTNDGNGITSATSYIYYGGYYDILEKDFRGFGYVKQTNPNQTTLESWFHQDAVFKGLTSQQVTKDGAGNIYGQTSKTYESTTPYSGCTFPFLRQTDGYVYDGTPSYKHTTVWYEYDGYGNITRKYSYGDVAVSGDEKDERIEYNYDTTRWIVSQPAHTYVMDAGAVTRAQTWFTYETGTGNLLTKTDWLENGSNRVASFANYVYGKAQTTTDPNLNVTAIAYDSTYTYPSTVTNQSFNFSTSSTYDYRYGKTLTKTDFNGNTTEFQYDVFGRLKKIINPYDSSSAEGTQSFYYENFGLGVGNQRVSVHMTEQSGTANYLWKESYFDGFGRIIKKCSKGPDGKVIVMQTEYDTMGFVSRSSLPYFEGVETPRWISYTYDPVGRVTQVTNPDATFTTKTYTPGTTTLIDANGHKKEEDRNVYGRLVEVREYTGISPAFTLYATTKYQYDLLNNLVQVTDAANHITSISYDTLGRKTSMTDPDMGHWIYQYDANGNLRFQTDAKLQMIEFHYDALNRLTWTHYPSGTDVFYSYDQTLTSNSRGKLTTVSDASGTTKFYYDMLGRVTKTLKTVDGVDYTTESSYDAMGRVTGITYPDPGRETVYYTYDTGGNLSQVGNYATYSSYNALGQIGTVTFGNGDTRIYQYYTDNNRLWSITANSQTEGLQNLTFTYDNVGNILASNDLLGTNPTQNSPTQMGSYVYDPAHPHAVSQTGGNSYTYDANGNMTQRLGVTLVYDYDNHLTSVGGTTTFVYDYAGNRVKKTGSSGTTIYIGKLYECTGTVCMKHIFAGSKRIISKTAVSTYYYHTDHLGSLSVVTNASGSRVEEASYEAFGGTLYNAGSVDMKYKYTGQEKDAETDLYFYGARYYDPTIGRFISADVTVQTPGDPQSLNRYSYVRNNPLIYIDPSGLSWLSDFTGIHIGGDTLDDLWNSNIVQGIKDSIVNSITPMNAIQNGGFFGLVGWTTGGMLSYSYEGGWGVHVGIPTGDSYLFASINWQSRGAGSGFTLTGGIGVSDDNFTVGVALSYNISQDRFEENIFSGVKGKGWSTGVNYNVNTGQMGGWANISIAAITQNKYQTSSNGDGRYLPVAWTGESPVVGTEGCSGGGCEGHWSMWVFEKLIRPTGIVHDNYVVQQGQRLDPNDHKLTFAQKVEFYGSILPALVVGRVVAGPRYLDPYGFNPVNPNPKGN